jgi:drug/metabolite transporter (DMT)-like permease
LTVIELTVLGAIWGGSFLFMRVSAADFGAFPLVEVRLALGAFVLLPFLWRERKHFNVLLWARLAGIGAINSGCPFVLFAWAAQRAPAGIGAITNAMAVLFATLVAFLFYGEKIGVRRSIGLLAGFLGVVVLASGKVAGSSVWPAVAAGTFAALLYGIGVNLIRRYLIGVPASAVAASTLLSASILLAPFAFYSWPAHPISVKSWLSSVLLGVLCTGTAFVLYYRLIHRIGGPRAATVTYLVPLFGVIWAWLALGEPLTVTMAVSGALILGGVAISQQRPASDPGPGRGSNSAPQQLIVEAIKGPQSLPVVSAATPEESI